MIKRFIRNLRQKPKTTRDMIALVFAGSFTALVSLVWLYNFPSKIPALGEVVKKDDKPAFSDFFSDFKDQVATVKESSVEEDSLQREIDARLRSVKNTSEPATTTVSQDIFGTTTASTTEDEILWRFSTTSNTATEDSSRQTTPEPATDAAEPVIEPQPQSEAPRSIRIVTTNTSSTTSTTAN